jgi:hypothetical protein
MTYLAGRTGAPRDAGLARSTANGPVLWAWAAVSAMLVIGWLFGISPNADLDDAMKLLKIRHFLDSGLWFDQTVPGILQPEPFLSHWPRILDLPYALPAWALSPLIGPHAALGVATFTVPLLLLLPALALLRRIVGAFGFERPDAVFALALIPAARALFEFSPGRIDYHNIDIVLLLASVVLTLSRRPCAALLNGATIALALAVSLEFAPFFGLVMAIHAFEFARGDDGATSRLRLMGAGLAGAAILAYAAIEPPARYGVAACDVYSAPHLVALCLAGATFAAASAIVSERRFWLLRSAAIALPGAAALALLAALYPQCLAGPYANLGAYVREAWLLAIPQERSLLARPDFVLSASIVSAAILFVGALSTAILAAVQRPRNRDMIVLALTSLLALALAIAYSRYLRYLPLFAAPGLVLALASLSPELRRRGALLARATAEKLPSPLIFFAPGLLVTAGLIGFHLARPAEVSIEPAATYAGSCGLDDLPRQTWPEGARVMAPPVVGMTLLENGANASVVAVPFHTAAWGVERAYRFLDPATADPRAILDQSRATHVAICAWRGTPPAELSTRYGFAATLMEGRPPPWLEECATDAASPLRIYRYPGGGGAKCPANER